LLQDAHSIDDLMEARPAELLAIANELKVEDPDTLEPEALVDACLRAQAKEHGLVYKQGVLERLPDGYGFIRSAEHSYLPGPEDVYVSPTQIRRFNLLTGDTLAGSIRPPKQGEKYFALV